MSQFSQLSAWSEAKATWVPAIAGRAASVVIKSATGRAAHRSRQEEMRETALIRYRTLSMLATSNRSCDALLLLGDIEDAKVNEVAA